jgi:hypothetical protein
MCYLFKFKYFTNNLQEILLNSPKSLVNDQDTDPNQAL